MWGDEYVSFIIIIISQYILTVRNQVQFSRSVVSHSLRPHGLQQARPPCPSPTPGVYSNSCPLSHWCHLTISSSVIPFSSRLLCCPLLLSPSIFPSIRVFSNESALCIRWPKYWSFSFNMSPSNEHSGLIYWWTGWISLQFKGLSRVLQHHSSKASILWCSAFFIVHFSHLYMTTGKTMALTRQTFVGKVMSLLFNMLSRLDITFLQGVSVFLFHGCSHHLQWFWSPSK